MIPSVPLSIMLQHPLPTASQPLVLVANQLVRRLELGVVAVNGQLGVWFRVARAAERCVSEVVQVAVGNFQLAQKLFSFAQVSKTAQRQPCPPSILHPLPTTQMST